MDEAGGQQKKKKLSAKMIQERIQKSVLKGFQYILKSDALGKRIDEKVSDALGNSAITRAGFDQAAVTEHVNREMGAAIEDLLASPRLKESIDGVLSAHTESTLTIPQEVIESVVTSRLEEILTSKSVMKILEPIIEHKIASYVADQIKLDDTTSLVQVLGPAVEEKVMATLDLVAVRDTVLKLKSEVEEKLADTARENELFAQMHDQLQTRMRESESLQATLADLADALEKRADGIASQLEGLNDATDQMIAKGAETEKIFEGVRKLDSTVDEKRQQIEAALGTLLAMKEEFEARERAASQLNQNAQDVIQRMEQQLKEHESSLEEIATARDDMETRQADAAELLHEVAAIRDDVSSKQGQLDNFVKELSKFKKEFAEKSGNAEKAHDSFLKAHAEMKETVGPVTEAVDFLKELKARLKGRGEETLQSIEQMVERASPDQVTVEKLKTLIGIHEESEANLVLSEGALENANKLIEEIEKSNAEIESNLGKIAEFRNRIAGSDSGLKEQTEFINRLYHDLETRSDEIRRTIADFAAEKQDLRQTLESVYASITGIRNDVRNEVLESVGTISAPIPSASLGPDQMNQVIGAVLESVTVTFGKVERALQAKLSKSVTNTREQIAEAVKSFVGSDMIKSQIALAVKSLASAETLSAAGIDVDSIREQIAGEVIEKVGASLPSPAEKPVEDLSTTSMPKAINRDELKAEIMAEIMNSMPAAAAGGAAPAAPDATQMELMIKDRVQKLVEAFRDDMAERIVNIVDERVMGRLNLPTPEEIQSMIYQNVNAAVESQMAQVAAQGGGRSSQDIATEVRQIVDQQFRLIQEYLERESIPRIVAEILAKMPR